MRERDRESTGQCERVWLCVHERDRERVAVHTAGVRMSRREGERASARKDGECREKEEPRERELL